MSFEDTAKAFEIRLQTNWTTTPIRFENVPFKESTGVPYVALFVRDGEGNQISLGTVAVRRWPGIVVVQVFVPQDSSVRLARQYADGIGAIFDRVQFSNGNSGTITCRVPSIDTIGVRNGWLQVNVTIPWRRERLY